MQKRRDRFWPRLFVAIPGDDETFALEQIPERLVVDLVMELHFGRLDEGAQFACAAISSGLLQIGEAALHVGTQDLGDPLRTLEVVDGRLNVIGQVPLGLAQVIDLGGACRRCRS